MAITGKLATYTSRQLTVFRRRNSWLRQRIPYWLIIRMVSAESKLQKLRKLYVPVKYRSRNSNIFHCCIQKTGSVWIRSMFCDLMTYQYCGLLPYRYKGVPRRNQMDKVNMEKPFPKGTIVSKLYMSYQNYCDIPKEEPYKTFFVMRDPRDLIVSWYFSTKKTHLVKKDIENSLFRFRLRLKELSIQDGLLLTINFFRDRGKFDLLQSWARNAHNDPQVKTVRFEDLVGDCSLIVFRELYDFLDIGMPDNCLKDLVKAYSFERLTGRKKGDEDTNSHLRSGTAGSWRKYFDDRIRNHFDGAAGNLLQELGYE